MVESHFTKDEVSKSVAELNWQVTQTYTSNVDLSFCNMHTQRGKTF